MAQEVLSPGYEQSAEELINTTVDNAETESEVISKLQREKEELEARERALVEYYIQETRPIYAAMIMDDFDGNVAGLSDGSEIYVDRSVMMVGESVEQTIAQAQEVYEHEAYHDEKGHSAPLYVIAETKGDIAAVIGGVEFTETELIEGLTVKQTGDQFVSVEYVEFKENLEEAMRNAELSIEDIEEAVNEKKDVTLIDDRIEDSAPEQNYTLAG